MRITGLLMSARVLVLAALMLTLPAPVWAAVQISFYSHEFGSNFPHAFVTLEGVDERTSERIDTNYGFTARNISPAILLGSVAGEVFSRDAQIDSKYIGASDRHFTFTLTDAEYDQVMATVRKWEALPQPSYNLNRQNCVYFVADVAASLGMRADTPKALMKKPRSYTESLTIANRDWLLARNAVIHRLP